MTQTEKEIKRICTNLTAISIVAKKLARELAELERQIIEDEIVEVLGDDWRENPRYEFLT